MMRYLIYCLLVLLVTVEACQNPLDGVQLGLKDPIQVGVIESRFYDPAGNPLPKPSLIRMAGPNGAEVVNTVNTTSYKINTDGILFVAASPLATISSQKPFRFSAVVEAPDYLTIIQPYTLTSLANQVRYIRWINMMKPPRTMAVARTAGNASSDGTVTTTFSTTTIQTETGNDRTTVTIPSGTKLTDRDGQAVGGDLTLAVIHTNARNDNATSYIPGNGVMSNVGARNGSSSLGTLRILSIAGSVTMQVYNPSYALAMTLSQPIPWTMDLNPGTFNVVTQKAIQAGDSIPLYSYDELINRWQAEKPGVVRYNSQTARFELLASARFVGAYVVGWTESICDIGPIFKVNSKLAGVDVNYLCKLIDVSTGQQVSSFYANVNNGVSISIYNQSKNRKLKLQIFDETDAWGKGTNGGLIAESAPGTTCDQTPVAINLASLPVPPKISLELFYACPAGKTLDESAVPSLIKTQYSDVGKGNWRDLVTVTNSNRKLTSYKLQLGRRYDLRASLDGGANWLFHENNYLVNDPDWKLKINADIYCK
ncbi:hypothetical protein GCM10028805_02810 [Spirosoma harenae]